MNRKKKKKNMSLIFENKKKLTRAEPNNCLLSNKIKNLLINSLVKRQMKP